MSRSNGEIATILKKIVFLLEMELDENDEYNSISNFKNKAYVKAANMIENLSLNLDLLYKDDGFNSLLKIPSIGKTIASHIQEYLTTGQIQYYNQLREKLSFDIDEFYGLEGIGPRTLKLLIEKLNVKNLEELEKAAEDGKIKCISGFSQKKEDIILKKIKIHRIGKNAYLLGEVYPIVKQIELRMSELDFVIESTTVGSVLRMKETIGNIDYLVSSDSPQKVLDWFVTIPEVKEILGRELFKVLVKLNNGINCNLIIVPQKQYGLALLYYTGSKEHISALKSLAQSKGLILNEWSLSCPKEKEHTGLSEAEIYDKLDLNWIPPEMRENRGEIELAINEKRNKDGLQESRISQLVYYNDLKGDLQVHTTNTDGKMTIEEMAYFANTKFKLDYIAITDHTKSLKITRGLNEEQLLNQIQRIDEINDQIKNGSCLFYNNSKTDKSIHTNYAINSNQNLIDPGFRILSSAEVNILKDGSLDISDSVLEKLDIVGAAIHSAFSLPIEIQTNRLITAAQNINVDIIFHPTGRIINKRAGYPVNISKLIESAKETNTVLEIDSYYDRLDLKDEYIKMAVENGVKLVIDSDSHHPLHYAFLKFGIGQARRGWATKNDILNTLPVQDLLHSLK
ncbi:MAG: DNA polymerase III [Candidatus Nitrosocosmicus sp.]